MYYKTRHLTGVQSEVNEMKKIIPILFLFLLVSSVMAINMPHPIYGHILSDGYAVRGAEIEVENLDTKASIIQVTNDKGFYIADLGNFDQRYTDGDAIRVSIVYCSNQEYCVKSTKVMGGGNEVSWDISDVITQLPPEVDITKYQCNDGTFVKDTSLCPKPVIEPEDEGSNAINIALSILSGILAIACVILGKFKWGKGFVGLANYYKRLGDEAKEREDYAVAEKHYARAAKMVSTAVKKARDGSYK